MSRYDKNKKLYEKVKTNDLEEYNEKIKDDEISLEGLAISRKEYREKKKMSMYFDDIDKELDEVSTLLDTKTTSEDSKVMKEDINLKDLIEQSKQNKENNFKIFTNTQHEILSNLDVDSETVDLSDIIGSDESLDFESIETVREPFDSLDRLVPPESGVTELMNISDMEIGENDNFSSDNIDEFSSLLSSDDLLNNSEESSEVDEDLIELSLVKPNDEIEDVNVDQGVDNVDEDLIELSLVKPNDEIEVNEVDLNKTVEMDLDLNSDLKSEVEEIEVNEAVVIDGEETLADDEFYLEDLETSSEAEIEQKDEVEESKGEKELSIAEEDSLENKSNKINFILTLVIILLMIVIGFLVYFNFKEYLNDII